MPSPTKPNVLPIWTQGNSGARTQPTNGEQFTGFVQNQRPDPTWHNWLWGIMSDWLAWLDFICDNPSNFPVSNAGHNVATSTNLQGQLDELDAVYSTIGLLIIPTVTANGTQTNFVLAQAPVNANSVMPTLDGTQCQPSEYTIQQISGSWYIVFGTAPAAGQQVSGLYFTGSSGVGVGGGVGAIQNVAGGVGIYWKNNVNVALLKSLVAGTNISIVDNGNGTITISASGGGGGGVETHGTAAAPTPIDPSVGITPTTAAEQVWWVQPNGGSGAQPITASPAIAAGVTVGQKLKLKSVQTLGAPGYLVIPNLSGTDLNGDCSMGTFAQTLEMTWDGTNWSEDSRRV